MKRESWRLGKEGHLDHTNHNLKHLQEEVRPGKSNKNIVDTWEKLDCTLTWLIKDRGCCKLPSAFCRRLPCKSSVKGRIVLASLLSTLWPENLLKSTASSLTSKIQKHWEAEVQLSNSNKPPTKCNNFPVYYPDVYLQLNMFRPAGPTTNTARLSPRYEGKTRGCHCSHWALDDGLENARNMLSCK
jgi:hypothetical protein